MTTETRIEPTTETRERTASDVLLAAARYIEEHGWSQGWYARDGNVCVYGAINAVLTGTPNPLRPYPTVLWFEIKARLVRVIGTEDGWRWNDDPDRTEAEVIAALRAASEPVS